MYINIKVHDDSIMSYLIALYVYYHGNNLSVFGITKGARDEDLNNKGLKLPEEINPEYVNPTLILDVQKTEEKAKVANKELDWEAMMRSAIKQSQQKTFQMFQAGAVDNTVFEHTPEAVIDDYDSNESIPLDFFSEINGF